MATEAEYTCVRDQHPLGLEGMRFTHKQILSAHRRGILESGCLFKGKDGRKLFWLGLVEGHLGLYRMVGIRVYSTAEEVEEATKRLKLGRYQCRECGTTDPLLFAHRSFQICTACSSRLGMMKLKMKKGAKR